MLRNISIFLGLALSLSSQAQPPNRDLLPLDTWALPGYTPVAMNEALAYPDDLDIGGISDLAFNSAGHLILLNRGMSPFLEFDADGDFVRAFGSPDLFTRSHGLTIDAEDNMWVTDAWGHTVMKLDSDANILMTLGTRDTAGEWNEGTGSHLFNQPNEVALDSAGNFYVVQGHGAGEPRVLKFSADGTYITQWGTRGSERDQLEVAHGIVIDEQDHLYVADRENNRVVIYDTSGEVLDIWQFNAMACSIYQHDDGYFYITTGFDGEFARVDAEGNLVGALGSSGKEVGQFGEAHYIVLDEHDNVFVGDVVNSRVQIYRKTGPSPEPVKRFSFQR